MSNCYPHLPAPHSNIHAYAHSIRSNPLAPHKHVQPTTTKHVHYIAFASLPKPLRAHALTLVIQLLRDNLTLWTSDMNDDQARNEDDGTNVQDC